MKIATADASFSVSDLAHIQLLKSSISSISELKVIL